MIMETFFSTLSDYTFIILNDEDVPLSAGPGSSDFKMILLIVASAVLLAAVLSTFYFINRKQLIKRLSSLRKQLGITETGYSFLNSRLEQEIFDLEVEVASTIAVEV